GSAEWYDMKMVEDQLLTPFLLQMAVFSAIDATERATGALSVSLRGMVEFENRNEPVRLRNFYATDGGTAMQTAIATALPLAYLMQGGFDELKVKHVSLELESFNVKKDMSIGQ